MKKNTIIRRLGYYEYRGLRFSNLGYAFLTKLCDDRGILKDGFKDFY